MDEIIGGVWGTVWRLRFQPTPALGGGRSGNSRMRTSCKSRSISCETEAESLGSEIAWSATAAFLEQTGTRVLQPDQNMRGLKVVHLSVNN
jgi:hypothetical protein